MRTTTRLGFLAMLVLSVACTVKDTTAPPLAGPSELSLRLGLQVVPDSILQDGASQAVLSIDASTADGRAARCKSCAQRAHVGGRDDLRALGRFVEAR